MGRTENVSSQKLNQERKWFSDKVLMITEDRNDIQRKKLNEQI